MNFESWFCTRSVNFQLHGKQLLICNARRHWPVIRSEMAQLETVVRKVIWYP
jgi:hypothetical protein